MKTLLYRGDYRFEVPDGGEFEDRNDMILAPAELLTDVSAVSVREALGKYLRDVWSDGPADLWLSPDSYADFDRDMSSILDVRLRGDGRQLTLLLVTGHEPWDDDGEQALRRLLRPMAERLRTCILRVETDDSWTPPSVVVELQPPIRRRSVGNLLELAESFSALASAAQGDGLTPASMADLLRGGRADALVGQPESDWFDAKRTAPRIASDVDKLSFAKDVAAFANSSHGGLLALGLRTRRTAGGDVIDGVTPFPANLLVPTRLRAILRARVYPQPLGVQIEAIRQGPGFALGLVHVPAQRSERKPFVVRGAVVDGRVREHFVGVPIRVGEDTVWDDVAGIHAHLVAGRVALSRQ